MPSGIVITEIDTDGIVLSNPATDDPVTITATGSVINQTATHNHDAVYGAPGYSWTVTNLGTIGQLGLYGAGIHLTGGGVVTNGHSGSSIGSITGNVPVYIEGGSGNLTNFGTLRAEGGFGAYLDAGGTVVNGESGSTGGLIQGGVLITGGGSGTVTNFGIIEVHGVEIDASSGTVVNFGTIDADSYPDVYFGFGVVVRQGNITNGQSGLISGDETGVLITDGSSTVTNGGTIIGNGGTAVQFGGGDDRLIVDPGGVFVGTVDGAGGSDVLELAAGSGSKTLSGLGTNFVNFETVVFDANAGWTVTLDDPFTGTILGFAAGDILDLTGKAATGLTYSGGVLTAQNGGAVVATLNITGSYTTGDFSVGADGHGGTNIGIAAALPPGPPTAINGSVTTAENHTVSGSVTSTGDIDNDVIYIVDVAPAHGTLTSFNGATGGFTYTPATNYFGSDSFKFHAVDEPVSSDQATESITVSALPPTGISLAADSAALAAIQVEGGSSGLHSSTALGAFTETGGISGDGYTFTLGGASGFSMSSASNVGTLSTGGTLVSGLTNGRVYPLTMTANDTTNSTHSAAMPFDVVVGSGQSGGNGNDTIKLDTGSGNLGISASTPTLVYGLNGKDTIDATGMTANVWFVGGPGADTMTGGSGVDTYLYAATSESKPGSGNFDRINNFAHGTDKIDLSAIAGITTVQDPIGGFTQVAMHTIAWIEAGGSTLVYANATGAPEALSSADMEISLTGIHLGLTTSDFHLA